MWSIVDPWFVVGDVICCFIFWAAKKFCRLMCVGVGVCVLIFKSPMQIVGVGSFVERWKRVFSSAYKREGIEICGGL